jgi:hypothetical protein
VTVETAPGTCCYMGYGGKLSAQDSAFFFFCIWHFFFSEFRQKI